MVLCCSDDTEEEEAVEVALYTRVVCYCQETCAAGGEVISFSQNP